MVVPYAYLGFKATNKSKGKFATQNGIIFNFVYFKEENWF